MKYNAKAIRPFIGSRDFKRSADFYRDLGFEEVVLSPGFSLFKIGGLGFYLQNAYVKDWVDNTMVFLEVDDVAAFWDELSALRLAEKYPGVKLVPIKTEHWGRECFLYDPSGVLWHFGEFFSPER